MILFLRKEDLYLNAFVDLKLDLTWRYSMSMQLQISRKEWQTLMKFSFMMELSIPTSVLRKLMLR